MIFPEEIETDRLLLRWRTENDAEEIFARYAQDPEVTRFLLWRPHRSIDDTLAFLRERTQKHEAGTLASWMIRAQDTGNLLGTIGLGIDGHKATLGYCLARDAWGTGFATEAVCAVVRVCQYRDEIWRIEATCHVANRASARVLEKSGFTFEGTLRRDTVYPNLGDEPHDGHLYAIVRGDDGSWS